MKTRMAVAVVCALVLFNGATRAQEMFTLGYTYEKGKTYKYADVTASNMTQEMMGQEVKVATRSNVVTRVLVDDVLKDGSMVLIVSPDSFTVASKSPRRDTTMVLKEFLGKRTRMVMSALGEISGRQVLDTVQMGGMMAGAGQRDLWRAQRFSGRPATTGEKWTSSISDTSDAMGGKMVNASKVEYALAGKETKAGVECLRITYAGTTAITGKGKMGGMDIYTEGAGKIGGTMFFDLKRGIIVMEEEKREMEMTAAVTGQQNMTIPITQSSTLTRTLMPE